LNQFAGRISVFIVRRQYSPELSPKKNLPVPWIIIILSSLLDRRGGSHIGVDADGGPGGEGVGE